MGDEQGSPPEGLLASPLRDNEALPSTVPALPPAALSSAATAAGSTQASPLYINTPSPPPPDVGISFERLADSGHWMYDVQEGMALTPRGDEYEPWQSFAEETAPRRGLSEQARRALDTGAARATESEDCTICIAPITGECRVTRLPCQHFYHEECVMSWLRGSSTCPTCRKDLERA